MVVSEIQTKFMLLAEEMSMQTVLNILPEEIDELFNIEQIKYVQNIFSRKKNKELNGVSDNVERLKELDILYTTQNYQNISKEDILFGNGYGLNIPSNLMFILNVDMRVNPKVYKCRLIEIDLVTNTLNDYHSKTVINSPVCYEINNKVEVVLNQSDNADGFILTYIRKPNDISSLSDIGCELSDISCIKIIENAVLSYRASISREPYSTLNNEINKIE
jgi:hypothetical protein